MGSAARMSVCWSKTEAARSRRHDAICGERTRWATGFVDQGYLMVNVPIMPSAEPRASPSLRSLPHRLLAWCDSQIETFYPGSFALVMATGVISNALYVDGSRELSYLLLLFNALAYPGLTNSGSFTRASLPSCVLVGSYKSAACIFIFYPRRRHFTLVAGSNVFGESLYLRGSLMTALCLWLFALAVCLVLIYSSFAVLTFLNAEHGADVIRGGWLLAIVGTRCGKWPF